MTFPRQKNFKNTKCIPGLVKIHIHALKLELVVTLVYTIAVKAMLFGDDLPELHKLGNNNKKTQRHRLLIMEHSKVRTKITTSKKETRESVLK